MKNYIKNITMLITMSFTTLCLSGLAQADQIQTSLEALLSEQPPSSMKALEELVSKSNPYDAEIGYASYYASRFIGRQTTSGHRYHPEKMTAAHESLPLGTVVKVINPDNSQEVEVTVNDRCAPKPWPFIDISRAAAKKIGLWGKGKIKVVIVPLIEDDLEEPA